MDVSLWFNDPNLKTVAENLMKGFSASASSAVDRGGEFIVTGAIKDTDKAWFDRAVQECNNLFAHNGLTVMTPVMG